MPIVFQPAQPVSPEISSAYGAAAQSAASLPHIVAAQQQQRAQMAAQAAQAQQANLQASALAQQGAQYRMGLQQSAYDAASARNQRGAMFQAQLEQAPQLQLQRAELAAWVNQQEMTQADQMRLQKLQSALSDVMNDESLTQQEKADYALRLKTGIDPLKARQEQTQTKLMEEQWKHAVKQNEIMTRVESENAKLRSMSIQDRVRPVTLPDGSVVGGYVDAKGDIKVIEGVEAAKPPKPIPFDTVKAIKEAEIEADAAHPPTIDDTTGKETRSVENRQYKFEVLQRLRRQHEMSNAPAGRTAQPGGEPAMPPPGAKPEEQAVADISAVKNIVYSMPNLSPEMRGAATRAAETAAAIIKKHGSRAKMPEDEAVKFDTAILVLRRLTEANKSPAEANPVTTLVRPGSPQSGNFSVPPIPRGPVPATPIE